MQISHLLQLWTDNSSIHCSSDFSPVISITQIFFRNTLLLQILTCHLYSLLQSASFFIYLQKLWNRFSFIILISIINKIFFIREMQTKTSSRNQNYQEKKCWGREEAPRCYGRTCNHYSHNRQHKIGTYTEGPPDQLHRPGKHRAELNS